MDRFVKFTKHQFNFLINHLESYQISGDPEVLHQIRVDIKKIKAILSLINTYDKEFRMHKNFAFFRAIFRKAGAIREHRVVTDLLLKYKIDINLSESTVSNETSLIDEFKSEISAWIEMLKKKVKKIVVLGKPIKSNHVKKYLSAQKKKIKSNLYPMAQMDKIHKVRKGIKEYVYLSAVAKGKKGKQIEFYDKMQSLIGELHDKQVLLHFLKKLKAIDTRPRKSIQSLCLSDKKEIRLLARNFYK